MFPELVNNFCQSSKKTSVTLAYKIYKFVQVSQLTNDFKMAEEEVRVPETEEKKPEAAAAVEAAGPDSNVMPVPKISHDWYQTETHVVIKIRIKKLAANMVKVDMEDTSLSVSAKIPGSDSEYSLELELAHPVLPAQSGYKVMSTKVEIKLKKATGVRWSALKRDCSAPTPGLASAPSSSSKGPYSSGRDWSAIANNLDIKEEEGELTQGAGALKALQCIYANASEDVKKAMNKSFQESGGKVLSTNWADIRGKKTEVGEQKRMRKQDKENVNKSQGLF